MSPTYQAPVASGTVPTLQNTRPCGCGATASVKIKYGLEASLCRFFFFCSEDHGVESNQDSAASGAARL